MAEKRQAAKPGGGGGEEEEEVPAFFKNLGSGSPKPRQKFCGMFCPVEGSLENKTIDFDSLSSGRGSPTGGKIVAKQRDVAHLGPDAPSVSSSWPDRKVEIRRSAGKEALQNLNDKIELTQWDNSIKCVQRSIKPMDGFEHTILMMSPN